VSGAFASAGLSGNGHVLRGDVYPAPPPPPIGKMGELHNRLIGVDERTLELASRLEKLCHQIVGQYGSGGLVSTDAADKRPGMIGACNDSIDLIHARLDLAFGQLNLLETLA